MQLPKKVQGSTAYPMLGSEHIANQACQNGSIHFDLLLCFYSINKYMVGLEENITSIGESEHKSSHCQIAKEAKL